MKTIARIGILGFSLLSAASAMATPMFLGQIALTDRPDLDVLHLPGCSGSWNRPVDALQLEVRNVSADIESLQVQFQNGDVQQLHVREVFAPGSRSRLIDLSGNNRCIRFIRVLGDSNTDGRRPGRQARVLFYGY